MRNRRDQTWPMLLKILSVLAGILSVLAALLTLYVFYLHLVPAASESGEAVALIVLVPIAAVLVGAALLTGILAYLSATFAGKSLPIIGRAALWLAGVSATSLILAMIFT